MRVARFLLSSIGPLLLLGALVLLGAGTPTAWAPSPAGTPATASAAHQTLHLRAAPSTSPDVQSHTGHLPAIDEVQTTREAEIDNASGSPHLSPSAAIRALVSPGRTDPAHRARALLPRACVVLCVFLC